MTTLDQVRRAPKVVLHDHLDGGLRPQTIIELAAERGHRLPDVGGPLTAESLGQWFADSADSGSLERYLETFDHTVAVMQTGPALTRVAREFVEDLVADGVVYAEVRYAPEQHVELGLSLDEVVAAVQEGFDQAVAAADGRIVVRQLLTAMRHAARSMEIAELAVAWRDRGVAGFDIAGDEAGYPIDAHVAAFHYARDRRIPCTAHAGEARGAPSVWETLDRFHPARIGHGVRSSEDAALLDYLRARNIHLEACPTSNLQTNMYADYADHPIDRLYRSGVSVGVNTDTRTITHITLTEEYAKLSQTFGWGAEQFLRCNTNALQAAFIADDVREGLLRRLRAGYAGLS